MKQSTVVFLHNEVESKLDAAKQAKKLLGKTRLDRIDEHIVLCTKLLGELDKKLLNPDFIIDSTLLEYALAELELKKALLA